MDHEDSDTILFQLLSRASVSADDAILIKKFVSSVIKEATKSAVNTVISRIHFPDHNCPIPNSLSSSKINQLVQTFEAIGDGDIGHGIERMKDNHRFLTSFRRAQRKIGMVIASTFIVTVVAGLCVAVVFYFKNIGVGVMK